VARACDRDAVAHLEAATGDSSRIAAEIEVRAVDPLHRHTEGPNRSFGLDVHRFQIFEKTRPVVPGRACAARDHVVAKARREWDRAHRAEPKAGDHGFVVGADCLEAHLVEADEVDLVHRQHDMADTEQRGDEGVAPRLRQHPVACIDQHHRQIGV
jgi:hypothetical protein